VNEEFRVSYRSVKDFSITIVNRWGRVVYKSDELDKGWNGRIAGNAAAPGVYYYDVKWTGFDGTKGDRQGFLHLLTGRR
jgi:gliding motility-associated-like protein